MEIVTMSIKDTNFYTSFCHIWSTGLQTGSFTSFEHFVILLTQSSKYASLISLSFCLKLPHFSHFQDQHTLAPQLATKLSYFGPMLFTSKLLSLRGAPILEIREKRKIFLKLPKVVSTFYLG